MHPRHHGATHVFQPEGAGQARVQVLGVDAEGAAAHLAGGDQLVHHRAGEVGRDGEAEPDVAGHRAARIEAGGVDAHQPAVQADQRAAGVAGVDRGIGLDEVLVAQATQTAAAHRRDDPAGHGLADAERVADGHHEVAHAQRGGVGERDRLQVAGRDLHHRHVGVRIGADELRVQHPPVVQGHRHLVGALDDVVVGEHQAPACIDDHARAKRLLDPLARHVREHPAEERIVQERVAYPHALAGLHADHRRGDGLEHGGKRRQWLAVDGLRQRRGGRGRHGGGGGRRERRGGDAIADEGTGHAAQHGDEDEQQQESGTAGHGRGPESRAGVRARDVEPGTPRRSRSVAAPHLITGEARGACLRVPGPVFGVDGRRGVA